MIRYVYPQGNPWSHLVTYDLFASKSDIAKVEELATDLEPDEWKPGRQGSGYFKYELSDLLPREDSSSYRLDFLLRLQCRMLREIQWNATGRYEETTGNRASDYWLIYYPEGSHIPWHRDPVPEGKVMYRMNLVISRAEKGGKLGVPNGWVKDERLYVNFDPGQAVLFRPSEVDHTVTLMERGGRLVLSAGKLFDRP